MLPLRHYLVHSKRLREVHVGEVVVFVTTATASTTAAAAPPLLLLLRLAVAVGAVAKLGHVVVSVHHVLISSLPLLPLLPLFLSLAQVVVAERHEWNCVHVVLVGVRVGRGLEHERIDVAVLLRHPTQSRLVLQGLFLVRPQTQPAPTTGPTAVAVLHARLKIVTAKPPHDPLVLRVELKTRKRHLCEGAARLQLVLVGGVDVVERVEG
mmetsp:Transcript_72527/g.136759  ORF Transcript_72527/g.136759 Transcript_72527/m.136759 type:complete len:209 (-) Transcript_72527:1258-1884(-)